MTCFLVARDREPNVFHGSDHAISRLVISSSTAVCYNSHSHCRLCPDFWWLICSLQKWWIPTVLVLFVCMCPHMFGSNTFCCSKDPWVNCWTDMNWLHDGIWIPLSCTWLYLCMPLSVCKWSEGSREQVNSPWVHSFSRQTGWYTVTGWWYTYPSEKYESQLEWLFPIYGTNQVTIFWYCWCSSQIPVIPQVLTHPNCQHSACKGIDISVRNAMLNRGKQHVSASWRPMLLASPNRWRPPLICCRIFPCLKMSNKHMCIIYIYLYICIYIIIYIYV